MEDHDYPNRLRPHNSASPGKVGFLSLRSRMVFSFVALLAGILMAVSLASTFGIPFTGARGSYGEARSEVLRNLSLVADLKKERLLLWLEERKGDTEVFSQNELVKSSLRKLHTVIQDDLKLGKNSREMRSDLLEEKACRNITRFLQLMVSAYKVYQKVQLVDAATGIVVASTADNELGARITDEQFLTKFPDAGDDLSIDINNSPSTGETDLIISCTVREGSLSGAGKEKALGLLISHIDPEAFIKPLLYTGEGLGETGDIVLVDQDLRILISLKFPLPDGARAKPLEYKINAEPARLAAGGMEGIVISRDYRREPVLAAYRHLKVTSDTGWGMVVKRDKSEVFGPITRRVLYSSLIGLIGVLGAAGLVFLIANRISNPIANLSRTAEEVEAGNLDFRSSVRGSDEVGALAATFNSMIGRIQNWHSELEEQVNRRTSELTAEIEERKKVEEELRKAVAAAKQLRGEAEKANVAKAEFLANMSHEIRTPMNAVIGMTELALNTKLTAEQHEYLGAVKVSAETLLGLIDDILDFSKMEAGKLELVPTDFKLRECVEDTMITLSVQAHEKGLELAYRIRPGIPDAVVGDPGRLRQVLMNLVGNAVKFAEKGEVVVRVELESESDEEVYLQFSVTDTGIGVSPEDRERIFEVFEQTRGPQTTKHKGAGLGLAISSRLVRMMGGRIRVESEVGKGSTFHFTVRLGLQGESPQPSAVIEASELQGLRVLVVDDNATNRRILEEMLIHWGMTPIAADGGHSALRAMAQAHGEGRPFSLVLIDTVMPGMDGFELAGRIKGNYDSAESPMLMLTSTAQRGDAARCLELGIAAYLSKPVTESELFEAVSTVLKTPPRTEDRPSLVTRHTLRESKLRLRVLLAEDNEINQLFAVRALEKMGHTVSVAENGKEVLEALEEHAFDLILMDVQMPEMDGVEATKVIREREKTMGEHIPIVALTAYAMKGDKERFLESGMDAYISKPIRSAELYDAIENLAARKAERD